MNRHKRLWMFSVVLGVLIASCTGCWDKIEIEERGFVMGIGIDAVTDQDKVALTYQIALPAAMYGEEGGGKKVWNVTSTSPTIIRAQKQIMTRLDKVPDLEHTRVLIIGEELAKQGINQYMDFFLRDTTMRRKTDVLVVEGKVEKLFEIAPATANSTSDYLSKILLLNETDVHRISSSVDLFTMAKKLRRNADFILAKAKAGKKDIEVTGAAVFKSDKLVGYLGPEDVRKTKWLINDISRGTLNLHNVEGLNTDVIFEIGEGKAAIKPIIEEDSVTFDVQIRVEGDIVEVGDLNFVYTTSADIIDIVEEEMKKSIEKECMEIMEKAQNEFEADFFDFGGLIKQYNNKWFAQHEKEWREIFKKSKLNVKAEVDVRRVGLIE